MSIFDQSGPQGSGIRQQKLSRHQGNPEGLALKKVNRRSFMKLTGLMGSGLILGVGYSQLSSAVDSDSQLTEFPMAFIQIASDGEITIFAKNPEIGQGVKTSLPMIIAEELDAAWEDVKVVQSPVNEALYGAQYAGGSRSIRSNWDTLRNAGATARTMLTQAAANRWKVGRAECSTQNSIVTHAPSGRQLAYAELAEAAANLSLPDKSSIKLKSRDQYRLLGQRKSGVDNLALVTGKPLFGVDQQIPGMAYATYEKCPATGGRVVSANLDQIRKLQGVLDAFVLDGNDNPMELMSGVAIVATSTWAAIAAKRKLRIVWDESDAAKDSWSAAIATARKITRSPYKKSANKEPLVERGNIDQAFSEGTSIEAFYQYPFASHAQLEPENCTAWYQEGRIELWAPTQTPQSGKTVVANVLGIDPDKVVVNQLRIGGGFGRRLMNDYMAEAAAISRQIDGPVKLQWTREDDMAHDFYRMGGFHLFKGAVDSSGQLSAWQNHFVTFSHDGNSPGKGAGLRANEFPQPMVKNVQVSQTQLPWTTPSGWWRAPGSNVLAFAVQSFIGELAAAAGLDHLDFLLDVMGEPRWLEPGNLDSLNTKRARDVITLAASKAGWGRSLPKGRGLGLAFHFSHAGHIAEMAEVSVSEDKTLRVHKVTVVADVGPIVNLSGAENQCEGSVVDALSTMLGLEVTHEAGRVAQTNFHQYPLLRMPHTPKIDVHFIESDNPPTGLGEPAFPPLAPAICNAIFAATGDRIRTLPLSASGYRV